MKRVFWIALGLGAGATSALMASRWMKRKTEALSPANLGRELRSGASDVGRLVRTALDDGRAAMRAREAELRASLP